jgi:hypothetical protein
MAIVYFPSNQYKNTRNSHDIFPKQPIKDTAMPDSYSDQKTIDLGRTGKTQISQSPAARGVSLQITLSMLVPIHDPRKDSNEPCIAT